MTVSEAEAPYTLPEPSFITVAPEEARTVLRRPGDLYRAIPLLQDFVAAGPPRSIEEADVEGYALIYYGWAREGSYCLRIKGDSMVPVFREGDLVGISPWKGGPRLLRGRFVAAWLEDEGLIVKRLQLTRRFLILEPLNPAYEPRFFDADEPPQLWRVDWWWGHQP